jgi:hypothetical protein
LADPWQRCPFGAVKQYVSLPPVGQKKYGQQENMGTWFMSRPCESEESLSVMPTFRVPDFVRDTHLRPLPCASPSIDPDVFFRPWSGTVGQRLAEAICGPCPVREACRAHGREQHEWGIWGGETETQRRRANRRMGKKKPRRRKGRT